MKFAYSWKNLSLYQGAYNIVIWCCKDSKACRTTLLERNWAKLEF